MTITLSKECPSFVINKIEAINIIRIEKVESMNEFEFINNPSLSLCVIDEKELMTWSDEIINYLNASNGIAFFNHDFQLKNHLTIGITSHKEDLDFIIKVHYTLL